MPVKIGNVSDFSIFSVLKADGTFQDLCELWVKLTSGEVILVWKKEGLVKAKALTQLVLKVSHGPIEPRDIEFVIANTLPLGNSRFLSVQTPLDLLVRERGERSDVEFALENKFPDDDDGSTVVIEELTRLDLLVDDPRAPDIQLYVDNKLPEVSPPLPPDVITELTELFIEVDVRQRPGVELTIRNAPPDVFNPPPEPLFELTELFIEVDAPQRANIEFALSNEFPVEVPPGTIVYINVVTPLAVMVEGRDLPPRDIEFAVSNEFAVRDPGTTEYINVATPLVVMVRGRDQSRDIEFAVSNNANITRSRSEPKKFATPENFRGRIRSLT